MTGSQANDCNMDMLALGEGGYNGVLGVLVVDTQEPQDGVTSQAFLVDSPKRTLSREASQSRIALKNQIGNVKKDPTTLGLTLTQRSFSVTCQLCPY